MAGRLWCGAGVRCPRADLQPAPGRKARHNPHCVCRRFASEFIFVIASVSEAIQCSVEELDCFVAIAPRNDGHAKRALSEEPRQVPPLLSLRAPPSRFT
jgi:hypothetical protein